MNLVSIFRQGAKIFKAPPRVMGVIDVFEDIYNELTSKGYNNNNLPPTNAIGEVLEKFNVSREEISKNLHMLDRPNKLTNAFNTFAPGMINSVKDYANNYVDNKGANGNGAATHNTITGRRKLPKIR